MNNIHSDPEYAAQEYTVEPQQPWEPAPKPKKPKDGKGRLIALALCCCIVGGCLGAGGVYFGGRLLNRGEKTLEQRLEELEARVEAREEERSAILKGEREATVLDVTLIDTSRAMTPAEVYAANVNSTVGITTSVSINYWGYTSTSAASGSGFVLTEDGYILTNYHVIEDSDSVTVTLYDGTSYEAAVVGYDQSNDIAILKVEAEGLSPVVLGDSDQLQVGENVMAIGNPLGELTFSLTYGLVSALDREVTMSNGVTMDLIQTDCAINSGNSGGALFNLYGEVVGITNAKYSGSGFSETSIDNIGFAIPINSVLSIVESIIEKGYIAKPYIGVMVSDVSEEAQRFGLPKGAAIQSVEEDSPAQTAGLKANDIVTKAGDREITCRDDLVDVVETLGVGDQLTVTVYRQGETVELTVEIGEQVQSAMEQPAETQEQQQQSQFPIFGWGY